MLIQNWKLALNRFSIEFGDRVTDHLYSIHGRLHRIIYRVRVFFVTLLPEFTQKISGCL